MSLATLKHTHIYIYNNMVCFPSIWHHCNLCVIYSGKMAGTHTAYCHASRYPTVLYKIMQRLLEMREFIAAKLEDNDMVG